MQSLRKVMKKDLPILLFVAATFIGVAYLSSRYSAELEGLFGDYGVLGMSLYALSAFVCTVLAPLNLLALLPVAAALWGPVTAALLSILGWTIGSVVGYWLAKRYGRPIVERFVEIERIEWVRHWFSDRHVFWKILFVRMLIPADVLSYALGLFADVPYRVYIPATLLGLSPFAFILAYGSTFPVSVQILGGALLILMGIVAYREFDRRAHATA